MTSIILMMLKLIAFLMIAGLSIASMIKLKQGLHRAIKKHLIKGIGMMGLSTMSILALLFMLMLVLDL